MSAIRLFHVATAVSILLSPLVAPVTADVYYAQPIAELKIIEGERPNNDSNVAVNHRFWWRGLVLQPYAVIDGAGEIYVTPTAPAFANAERWRSGGGDRASTPSVAIRVPQAREVTGKIYLPKSDYSGMVPLSFSIAADQGREDLREEFLRTKLQHYESLMSRDAPGTAWFRHQVRETRHQLGLRGEVSNNRRDVFRSPGQSMENTYALVSGGRAVSENLQLERMLPEAGADSPTIALESIEGVTVQAFDWTTMIKDAKPERDPLAALIPSDQYAVFLPSFEALVALADHAGEQGTLVLRAAEPRAEDARVRQRYERQLGLSLNQLARVLGPESIESVAMTGADPYLRTGADVAVLFEAKDVKALRELIDGQVALSAGTERSATAVLGEIEGVSYTGFRSPNRTVCSYVATLGNAVVVTNSPTQLEQLVRVSKGEQPSLDSLNEYTFFRDRYRLGDANETGLLILSDDTIRKWCGPRWRIAASRRIRAAAVMAELQADHLDRLVRREITTGPLHTTYVLPDAGEFTLGPDGVHSSVYGTLEFLTPILELHFAKVTKSEAEFYGGWRAGYERNWSNFFDPIAVQFHASSEKLAIDLTVMPLINFSDYRQLVAISRGAVIGEHSGDPHAESLVHGIFALNTDAEAVKQGANMATTVVKVDPLSWIGQSAALYADEDPFWTEMAKLDSEGEIQSFMQANAFRLPIAANIDVKNGFKLIAFLAGVRAYIEQSAPGMTVWETLEYKGQAYVKVSPSEHAKSGNPWDKMALYYVPSGESLVVSIREDVLKLAIDRLILRREKIAAKELVTRTGPPWLGENFCVTLDGRLLKLLHKWNWIGTAYQSQMQLLSWSNLAILNEWHARYPNQDLIEIHQRMWQRKLICPGGGEYRWNERWQTMESTIYGHPGEPRLGVSLPTTLQSINSANFGQTFEENGLRARVELTRVAAKVSVVNHPQLLTHLPATVIGSGKESKVGISLPSGKTFDTSRPHLPVPLHAPPADKLNITRMFYCREDSVSTGPRSAQYRPVNLWVPVPKGPHTRVVAEKTDSDIQYMAPARDLADGVYCLHTGQFSNDSGAAAPEFCAPFVVRGYGEPDTGAIFVTEEGKGVKLSVKIKNKGKGVFDDGFIVMTLQKWTSDRSEFKGRKHLKLKPIPANGEVESSIQWDMSEAEPGTYYFDGHVNYNYLWDVNALCEVKSERFEWHGEKTSERSNNSKNDAAETSTSGEVVAWGSNNFDESTIPAAQFTAISAGSIHSLGIKSDGTLAEWGRNLILVPAGQFTAVAGGSEHNLGLRTDGTLVVWGRNISDQTTAPVGRFTAIATGRDHNLGIRTDNTLAGWGANDYGQSNVPPGQFKAVAAGLYHSLGIKSDGTLAGWGRNNYGQANVPAGKFVAIAAGGYHSLGIRTDGTLVGWGWNASDQTIVPAGKFVAIAAGELYSLGLRSDGTLVGWGMNAQGQSTVPAGQFTAIAAGAYHGLALKSDGTLVSWGSNKSGQTLVPAGNFVAIAAGGYHSLGVRSDGTLVGWGHNIFGQIAVPTGQFTAVAAGWDISLGLRNDGTLIGWGNEYGLSAGPVGKFKAIAAGGTHCLGLRTDGTLVGWGHNDRGQATVPPGQFTAIAAGQEHSLGIKSDGTLAGWGHNDYGQTNVPAGEFVAIAAGGYHSLGLRSDGTLAEWGRNTTEQSRVPAGEFTAIAAGSHHNLGLRRDGTLAGWGLNNSGQILVPTGSFLAIAAAGDHSLALRSGVRPGTCLVTFRVQVPESTPADASVYISGNDSALKNWNPPGLRLERRQSGEFEAQVRLNQGSHVAYKVTRGSWNTVEKGANKEEISNREFDVSSDHVVTIRVDNWSDHLDRQ